MSEEKKKFNLSPKTKKILNYVLDAVLLVVLVFAIVIAVSSIKTRAKGYGDYTELFGSAYVSVVSDSMDAAKPAGVPEDKPEGFKKGDLIKVKMLNKSGRAKLEVGDIITFSTKQVVEDKYVLNTHRIVDILESSDGTRTFITKGDNNFSNDLPVFSDDVIGIYQSKVKNVGFVMMFMGSSTGFIVFVIVPSVLIVIYCLINLIIVILKEKKVQTVAAEVEEAQKLDAERERIRQELLAEMQGAAPASQPTTPTPVQPVAPAESAAQPETENTSQPAPVQKDASEDESKE